MPAFNAAGHISAAIQSVQAQTHQAWELLIIDDGSSDDTIAIVTEAMRSDPRIRLKRMAVNGGAAAARNAGLDWASGTWITVLDCDDRYEPDRLAVLLDAATETGAELLADNLSLFDESADKIMGAAFVFADPAVALDREGLVANDGPPRFASLGHLKPFYTRALLERTGCRYPVDIRMGEDFTFLFTLMAATPRAVLLRYAGYRYTLPYSVATGARSTGSRTPYAETLADIERSTKRLVAEVNAATPPNPALVGLLVRRRQDFIDNVRWQRALTLVRKRRLLVAFAELLHLEAGFIIQQIRIRQRRKHNDIRTILTGVTAVAGVMPVRERPASHSATVLRSAELTALAA